MADCDVPIALRGAVARLALGIRPIDFVQHRVIDLQAKRTFDGFEIRMMGVCGQLNPIRDPLGNIMHEVVRGRHCAITEAKRQINFVSASSAVHVQQSPQPSAFLSAVVFFSFEQTNDQISSHCTRFAERLRNCSS
jgi:hypothetical protein